MKILIIGGGPVTQELLKAFESEKELKRNEVVVVEIDAERAEEISKAFDVVVGVMPGIYPSTNLRSLP
jgi:Trk K+ transport system NAD-binding subunit